MPDFLLGLFAGWFSMACFAWLVLKVAGLPVEEKKTRTLLFRCCKCRTEQAVEVEP